MTDFETLLDKIDAAYVAYNEYFKEAVEPGEYDADFSSSKSLFEALKKYPRLAELDKQIDDAHRELYDAYRAVECKERRHRIFEAASQRAEARPHKMTLWLDPKIVREEARKHVSRTIHRVFGHASINEFTKLRQVKSPGKCTQCGEEIEALTQCPPDKNGGYRCEVCFWEERYYPRQLIL